MRKTHDKIRNIIQKWKMENFDNLKDIQINFEVYGIRNIYLYTNRPGIIIGKIGKYGRCINELKKMLKTEGINKKIHVIELGGGYQVQEINVKRSWL